VIYAWLGAILIGVSLGLLGSGGSILTVPILVYLVHHAEKQAVAESFAIVGAIALFGGVRAWLKGKVDGRSVLLWAVPGMAGAAVGHELSTFLAGAVQILILGFVMLAASVSMFRSKTPAESEARRPKPLLVVASGFGVGMLTALVGIGGGFVIVPALVLLTGTPMHRAVGTSLCVIAINCATSLATMFVTGHGLEVGFDGKTVLIFAALGIAGSYVGAMVGAKMNQRALKRVFAVFLVVLAVFVIWKQAGKLRGGGDAQRASDVGASRGAR
jgi:uncharacterized membrane protein YfcA